MAAKPARYLHPEKLLAPGPLRVLGAFLFLGAALLAVAAWTGCAGRGPRIDSMAPRVGNSGDVLTIEGAGFKSERGDGRVLIAGISPTASAYLEWTDTKISVRVPDFGDSGLVYVVAGGKRSNPDLFTDRSLVPKSADAERSGGQPYIASAEPQGAAAGDLVVLKGRGFGAVRGNGAVSFAWEAEAAAEGRGQSPGNVEASDADLAYEGWSDTEIRVRVPDGAVSGKIVVKSGAGAGVPRYLDIAERPGRKAYRDRRSYVVNYSVDLAVSRVSAPGSVFLRVPTPAASASQFRRQTIKRSAVPQKEDERGTDLYRLDASAPGARESVDLSYLVDAYAVETKVNSAAIPKAEAAPWSGAFEAAFAAPGPLVPSDAPAVADAAAAIAGGERNPYLAAKAVYDWLTAKVAVSAAPNRNPADGALEALREKRCDDYGAALLYCALCRARGIAARPVSGYAVLPDRGAYRHYWAEVWIPAFGWLPVDPAYGAGAAPAAFGLRPDARDYYFGNLDAKRVAFSRGFTSFEPVDSGGRTSGRVRSYALQSIWEEATGGIDAYSSLWNEIAIGGVY